MVTVGFGGFIPFVGIIESSTDYTLLAIALFFMLLGVVAAMKLDSIPFRITMMLVCWGITYPLADYGLMYQIFSILFGMAVLARTVYDTVDRGAEV